MTRSTLFGLLGLGLALLTGAGPLPRAAIAASAEPSDAAFDSLLALERAQRYAAQESLATLLVARYERSVPVDTVGLTRALTAIAQSRRFRSLVADGVGARSIERAIALSEPSPRTQPAWLAWAHTLAANIHAEMLQGDTALAHLGAARRWAERSGTPRDSLLASARETEGYLLRDAERWSEARDAFAGAAAAIERRLGPYDLQLVAPLSELGSTLKTMGDYDAARDTILRAVRIAERDTVNGLVYLEYALSVLGSLERHLARSAEAVEVLARVADLAQRISGPTSVRAWRAIGNLSAQLDAAGDEQASRRLNEASIAGLEAALGPTHRQVVNSRIALANTMVTLGDTAAARHELDRADSALAARQTTSGVIVALARIVRSALVLKQGDAAAARRLAFAAAEALPEPSEGASVRIAEVAEQLYFTIRTPADRAICDSLGRVFDTLRALRSTSATGSWLASLSARAAAEARAGDLAGAWAHGVEADDNARERVRESALALSDRAALLMSRRLDHTVGVLVSVAGDDPVRLREAWDRVIRWRGMVRDVVSDRRDVTSPGDPELARAHDAWIAASRERAQFAVAGAASSGDSALMARFEASAARADEAERRFARLARAAGQSPDSASLAAVLAHFEPGRALVAFVESDAGTPDAKLWAFVARGGEPAVRRVAFGASAPLAGQVAAWTERLGTPPSANGAAASERAARLAGEAVRRALWDPVATLAGDARDIVIVPDGPVFDLPWFALPAAGNRYLADAPLDVSVMPAERDLLRHAAAREGEGLLALGDPAFGAGAPARAEALRSLDRVTRSIPGFCRGGATASLPPLPGARAEAEEIARRWKAAGGGDAELLTGEAASERAFRSEAPGRRALHLATHGVVIADTCGAAGGLRGVGGVASLAKGKPRRTAAPPAAPAAREESPWLEREVWLALAGANRATHEADADDDGLLTAGEVATLDLRGVDRVVLSACQSGVAERWTREGVLGMRRAFHLAGVRTVVASQWAVADEATREWMDAFYATDEHHTSVALHRACRDVLERRRREHRTTHPFYWAAFTATGD